jgi:hypothetical protein
MDVGRKRHFWQLHGAEQAEVMLAVTCTTCMSRPGQPCVSFGGDPVEPWHAMRFHEAEAAYERDPEQGDRVIAERKWSRRQHEEQVMAEMRLQSEIQRTCPWCGTLFDTVILMEQHEEGCE